MRRIRLGNLNFWKIGLLALTIVPLIGVSDHSVFANSSIDYKNETVIFNGKFFAVKLVSVDLSDPYLCVMPVTAIDGIGHVESFDSIMKRTDAAAGINGTFFNAYVSDPAQRYPNGLMVSSGEIVHSGANQSLSVLTDKVPRIEYLKTGMDLIIKLANGSTYTITPWGVNKYYGAPDQVVLYTSDFGSTVPFANGIKIVIDQDKITQITSSTVSIPKGGQVLFVGDTAGNHNYILPSMHIGDGVQLVPSITGGGAAASSYGWEAAIGVGPKLITDGKLDIDFARDGFTDPMITTTSNARSFVGVDKDKRLIMGTISFATVTEMANVLLKLGLTDAMNMDGGSSSGLYYQGSVLVNPGRMLSNALVVKHYATPQVQLVVNNIFVNEFRGYINTKWTMVPFRGIFERINASFEWSPSQYSLTAHKGNITIVLRPNDPIAEVNGKPVQLDAAPTILDNHIYIPLRFVVETLGGNLEWDSSLYRVSLTLQ